jgi:hypothetical protein
VDTSGLTATAIAPDAFGFGRDAGSQIAPARCWSVTLALPRTRPVSRAVWPYSIAFGLSSAIRPTRNHVERSPSRVRTSAPLNESSSPRCVTNVSESTRCDGFTSARTSTIWPGIRNVFASFACVSSTGPHEWCGDAESYGSGTDTR